MILRQIATITIQHSKIDKIVECLEKAGYVLMVEHNGYLQSTYIIAELFKQDNEN